MAGCPSFGLAMGATALMHVRCLFMLLDLADAHATPAHRFTPSPRSHVQAAPSTTLCWASFGGGPGCLPFFSSCHGRHGDDARLLLVQIARPCRHPCDTTTPSHPFSPHTRTGTTIHYTVPGLPGRLARRTAPLLAFPWAPHYPVYGHEYFPFHSRLCPG